MDLYRALKELHIKHKKIDRAIRALEELRSLPAPLPVPKPAMRRRGRKSMGHEERQEVAERMRKYWAARRTEKSRAERPKAMSAGD